MRWIEYKQRALNEDGFMITDHEGIWENVRGPYGARDDRARRRMTDNERIWNAEMVEAELAHPPRPPSSRVQRRPQRQEAPAQPPAPPDPWLHCRAQRVAATSGPSGNRFSMEFDAQETRYAEPEGSAPPGALVRPRPSRAPLAPQEEAHEESRMDEGDGAIPEEEDEWAEEDSMASSGSGPPQDWECGDIYYYAYQYEDLKRQAGGGRDPQLEQEATAGPSVNPDSMVVDLVRPRPSQAPPPLQEDEEAPEEGLLSDIPWDEGDGDAGPPDHWGCGDIQYYAWKEEDEQRKAGCTEKEIREQDQMMEEELRTRALRLGALGSVARARERWAAELDDDAVSALSPDDALLYRRVLEQRQRDQEHAPKTMPGADKRAPVTPPKPPPSSAGSSERGQESAPWRGGKRKTPQDTPEDDDLPKTKAKTPEPPDYLGAPGQGASARPSAQARPPPSSPPAARPATAPSIAPKARPVSRPPKAASHRGPGAIGAPPRHARPPPPPPPEARASSLPRYWDSEAERERHRHVEAERGRIIGARQRSMTVSAKAGQPLEGEAVRHQPREDAAQVAVTGQLVAVVGQLAETARHISEHLSAGTARREPMPADALGKDYTKDKTIAKMPPEEAAKLPPKPTPPLVFSTPHEASQPFHDDWTLVPKSWKDPAARQKEYKLRDDRNRMICEKLTEGGPAFYPSSGNSMWPMLQSHDHCLFHPIQEVRMGPRSPHLIDKPESTIEVGDVVFCRVRPTHQFYAHFVRWQDWDRDRKEHRYWIGGLSVRGNDRPFNGHCYREDIFGILINVYVNKNGAYHRRPHPRTNYNRILPKLLFDEWCKQAEKMCEAAPDPEMQPPVLIDEDDVETKAAMAELSKIW